MQKSEQKLSEDFFVESLVERGWEFVRAKNLLRSDYKQVVISSELEQSIRRINSDMPITDEEVRQVIQELNLLPTNHNGLKQVLAFLKYGIGVKFEKDRVVRRIRLLDYQNPENNKFVVGRQVRFSGKNTIIADIVLFVNGIPLVIIECKDPTSSQATWEKAYRDIKAYEKSVAELFKFVQFGVATAFKTRYFPIVPWQENVMAYVWKSKGLKEEETIFELLSRDVLINFIRNYIFWREDSGDLTKVMARYMQYRAAEKIYHRVIDNLEGKSDKNKGLIWHWQGSGKTLTMIFAGHKLFFDERLENPTMFFVVDRNDLETQLEDEFRGIDLNFNIGVINSVNSLKKVLRADKYRGQRGVFLTLLHKFRPDETFLLGEKTDDISKRKNVIVFLDEVHRTQYGTLAGKMRQILENAFFFGFTGTPISQRERNTYEQFGYPIKEEKYLDRYFISDSLEDGFTVPIVYQPKLEKVHLNKKDLEKLMSESLEGGDLDEIQKSKIEKQIAKRISKVTLFLENPRRIDLIAQDISNHFRENVQGKFKAMVVAGSRKACVVYKKYLDKYLPIKMSEVVMTFNQKDQKIISDFYKDWRQKYKDIGSDEQIRKKIREKFISEENPQILIVTDMLLTGFDAKILQVMYLDKVLRRQKLLQAIARTNRPLNNIKPVGVIVDYIGLLSEMKKAYRTYFEDDSLDSAVSPINKLEKEFERLIQKLTGLLSVSEYKIKSRDQVAEIIERLVIEDAENVFVEDFRKTRKLFELLGPSKIKIKYYRQYKYLAAVYAYYIKTRGKDEEFIPKEDYFQRTLDVLHQSIDFKKLYKNLKPIKFDLAYLSKLISEKEKSKNKTIALLLALEKIVLMDKRNDPIYLDLADKVEKLIEQWKTKKHDYETLFEKANEVVSKIKKGQLERESLGLSEREYGVLMILSKVIKNDKTVLQKFTRDLFRKIKDLTSVSNWRDNPALTQKVLRELREYTRQLKLKYSLEFKEMDNLYKKLADYLTKDYLPN